MNASNEIKSLLNSYLNSASDFEDFQKAFAFFLRTASQYDKSSQELTWAIDRATADFDAGRISPAEATAGLVELAQYEIAIPAGSIQTETSNEILPTRTGTSDGHLYV